MNQQTTDAPEKPISELIEETYVDHLAQTLELATSLPQADRDQLISKIGENLFPVILGPMGERLGIIHGLGIPQNCWSLLIVLEDARDWRLDPKDNNAKAHDWVHCFGEKPLDGEVIPTFRAHDGSLLSLKELPTDFIAGVIYGTMKATTDGALSTAPDHIWTASAVIYQRLIPSLIGQLDVARTLMDSGEMIPGLILVIPKEGSGKTSRVTLAPKEVGTPLDLAVSIHPQLKSFYKKSGRRVI